MKVGQMFITKSDLGAHLSSLRQASRVQKKLVKMGATDAGRRSQKKKRTGAAPKFLERYHRDGDKFFDHIVTGDQTWVSDFTPEGKSQSLEWHHPQSPS
jgi:hypothetical protein